MGFTSILIAQFGPNFVADSPGFNINFESAPFKLTAEYIEILGGVQSEDFKHFQVNDRSKSIILIAALMQS